MILSLFGGVSVLILESDATGANIKTATDALWWTFVTVTTVGYGDFYPVTVLGRCVAVLLMIVGIGTFGTFTAYIASFFAETENIKDKKRDFEIIEELKNIHDKIDKLIK